MWKELGKLAVKAGGAYLENRDAEGMKKDLQTVRSIGQKISAAFNGADDSDSDFDIDEYTDSIIEQIDEAATEAQKYDILSQEFYTNMFEALGTGYSAMNEFMEADPDMEYFEDNFNRIDEACTELQQSISSLCKGGEEARIKVEVEDNECDFEMVATGAYPLSFGYQNTILVGLVNKGCLSTDETIAFPDETQAKVTSVFMFGIMGEYCEAGDVVCLIVEGNHFDDFEYCTKITCRNAKPSSAGEYLREVKACLANGATISERERRILDKLRKSLNISEEFAAELEKKAMLPKGYTPEELEYLDELKACLADDGTISDRERRLLDKLRKSLGISEERAKELGQSCDNTALTKEEQEYADEIKACLAEDNEISDKERRLLNRLYKSLNISDERAREIEQMIIK